MLISEKYKFIFIHIYKNAGTSINGALLPFTSSIPFLPVLLSKFRIRLRQSQPYESHIHTSELIKKLGEERFKSYYSFAFIRNPWDWQVSLYSFMLKDKTHRQHNLISDFKEFEEYIEWRCRKEIRYQKDFIYNDDGKLLVNFVGRYENLEDDFRTVCSEIGVSRKLPKLNVSDKKPYQEYYNRKTIALVKEAFSPDIELFEYEFE